MIMYSSRSARGRFLSRSERSTREDMRIGDVIGTVTLNRSHPSLSGASFKVVAPISWDNLAGRWEERLEELVVYDELGAGLDCRIAISEGREAAMPFHPEVKPIDAYNAAIIDTLDYVTPTDE
jgi:ethanolamine utilization protein EutN